MGNISAEQKLQLVQMIRAEQKDNRTRMRSRERMLYGTELNDGSDGQEELPLYMKGYTEGGGGENNSIGKVSLFSFRFRLVISILLFAGFLLLDTGGKTIGRFDTEQLKEEVNKNFDIGLDEVVFDFEHNFPYTLFNEGTTKK